METAFGDPRQLLQNNVTYLEDSETSIKGVSIYGSPWQPEFCDWAFNLPRKSEALREKWAKIPDKSDIVITHGPVSHLCFCPFPFKTHL